MNKMVVMAIAVLVLAVGSGAYVLSVAKSDNPKTDSADTNTPSPKPSTSTSTDTGNSNTDTSVPSAATITYSNSGFDPATMTVTAGSKVTIKNTSSRTLDFNSDPHPQHTDDPELNAGLISSGESKTITVTKTGSHSYHNHLSPGDTGTLIVQ